MPDIVVMFFLLGLLAGGVVIGALYGPQEGSNITDLLIGAFHAVLAIFLLEMGLAAMRTAIPEANISLAMLASLGLTFPLNVILGITLHHQLITWLPG